MRSRQLKVSVLQAGNQLCGAAGLAVRRVGKARQLLISPGRGDPEAGVNQNQRNSTQCGKKIQRFDTFATAGREGRLRLQEKRNIGTERFGNLSDLEGSQRAAENLVQREQRGGGVSAAAAQTRGDWDFLLQMDLHTVTKVCRAQITFGCPKNQVARPSAESRIAASELDAMSRALEVE